MVLIHNEKSTLFLHVDMDIMNLIGTHFFMIVFLPFILARINLNSIANTSLPGRTSRTPLSEEAIAIQEIPNIA